MYGNTGEPDHAVQRPFTTSSSPDNAAEQTRVGAIMAQLCPGFRLTDALATNSKYELPADKVSLEQIFLRMLMARAQGMISSWGVSSMTLEDVFLHICNAQA